MPKKNQKKKHNKQKNNQNKGTSQQQTIDDFPVVQEVEQPPPDERPQKAIKYTASHVINLLSSAGYHRARVRKLSNYDRITGGVNWALSTVLDPTENGGTWLFEEDWSGRTRKTPIQKSKEVEQTLDLLNQLNCPHPIVAADFLNVNGTKLFKVVQWLCDYIRAPPLMKNHYNDFVACFKKVYKSFSDFEDDYMRNLRQHNTLMTSDIPRMQLFDTDIIRDDYVTGKMAIAEYMHYARNGCKKYPKFSEEEEIENGEFVPVEDYISARTELTEIADKTFNTLQKESAKQLITHFYETIDELNIANLIIHAEDKFLKEGESYFKDFEEFTKMNELHKEAEAYINKIMTVSPERVKMLVEESTKRAKQLQTTLTSDLGTAQQIKRQIMGRNPDRNAQKKNCAVIEEKMRQMNKKITLTEQRRDECTEIIRQITDSFAAYTTICEKRDSTVPNDDESGLKKLSPIERNLADEFSLMTAKINHVLAQIDITESEEEKTETEMRSAFYQYIIDVNAYMSDWYWKAKFLQAERRDIQDRINTLKLKARINQHKIHYAAKEAQALSQFNIAVRKTRIDFPLWEKDSFTFHATLKPNRGNAPSTSETSDSGGAKISKFSLMPDNGPSSSARAPNGNRSAARR